ncbi:MAG TPA: LURP-one-related family protein [Ktedonobacteraceae bacterium]
MKFHIKERAWTLREAFIVRDQGGQPVFKVTGKFFHIGDNLSVTDYQSHDEVAHIKQRLIALTPHYEIYQNGEHRASLHEKLLHLFGERFKIQLENGQDYHIQGNLWNWNFAVSDEQGNLLAEISKRLSLFEDSYGVDIAQNVDVPLMIALAICIEMIRHHHAEKAEKERG